MRPASSPPRLPTLILLTALAILTLNMFLPALAHMAEALETDYATASLSIGGYLAVTAVVQLFAGPLSDRIGRRPVVLGALAIFIAASAGCAMAGSIEVFLAFRVLQAVVISCFAMSMAIVRDTTAEQKAAGLISYITMAMAVAPMLGPVLGGALDTLLGWRANFWFYAAAGVAMLLLAWADLGETRQHKGPGQRKGGYLELLAEPRFWGFALCTMSSTGAFYTFIAGAPLVATETFGITSATLGMIIGSITAGFMFGSFLSGRLTRRFEVTTMMLLGRIVACIGLSVGLAAVLGGHVELWSYFASTIMLGLGNGLTMPSAHAGILSVRPDLAGTAAGFNGALTVAGGAVLTTFTAVVLVRTDPPAMLLAIMLALSVAGLAATLWVRRLRRVAPPAPTAT
ncbi:MAG: multidrug effflux MFS transporter [Minwuia sp.]|uniref:multidrug effflux MFS transporter n=1 Tax=Minwuia sp. TaxID=2493630 RepID=UPI003A88A26E